jgi:hypothetical protein
MPKVASSNEAECNFFRTRRVFPIDVLMTGASRRNADQNHILGSTHWQPGGQTPHIPECWHFLFL